MKLFSTATPATIKSALIDNDASGLLTLDAFLSLLHQGKAFFHTQSETLASAATSKFLLTTPATGKIHFKLKVNSNKVTTVQVYEAGDRVGAATVITGKNRDRNSATAPTLAIRDEIATGGTTDGTLIFAMNNSATGGDITFGEAPEDKLVLKQSTKYLIVLTSGAADNLVSTFMKWSEL